jgi:hypothetical protein
MKTLTHLTRLRAIIVIIACLTGVSEIAYSQSSGGTDIYTSPIKPDNYQPMKVTGQVQIMKCPPSALQENEPPHVVNIGDETNYGCDGSAFEPARNNLFTDINLGDSFCGDIDQYVYNGRDYRDTDWYRLMLDHPATVEWSAEATFPVEIIIFQGPCDVRTVLNSADGDAGSTVKTTATLEPGEYYFWIGPNGWGPEFKGNYVCSLNETEPAGIDDQNHLSWNNAENLKVRVYPNPFSGAAKIEIAMAKKDSFTLQVTDLYGRPVENIFKGTLDEGNYTFNLGNDRIARGIYFLRVITANDLTTVKLMVE